MMKAVKKEKWCFFFGNQIFFLNKSKQKNSFNQ